MFDHLTRSAQTNQCEHALKFGRDLIHLGKFRIDAVLCSIKNFVEFDKKLMKLESL